MKLLKFELKKLFSKKFVLVSLALLFCLNAFNIWQNYAKYSRLHPDCELEWQRKVFYEKLEGELTSEKVKWIKDYNEKMSYYVQSGISADVEFIGENATADMYLSGEFLDEIKRIYNYNSEIKQLKADNAERRENAQSHANVYLEKTADKIDRTYGDRTIGSFYDYNAFETYFSYTFSSFFVLLVLLLAFSPLFAGEYESGMYLCFMASENGRKKTSTAKSGAMAVFTVFVSALFAISDLIMFYFCVRLRGFFAPIYALESFKYSSLTCSIGTFIFLMFLIKVLGFVSFGFMYSVLSSVFHKSYEVFACGLVLTFALMFLSAYSKEAFDLFNVINPINLIIGSNMFMSFDVVNIFSSPVWRWALTLVCCLVFAVLMFFAVNAINNKNVRRAKR